ncbi:MAG: tetratricopeptide repeat protein [Reichenbachiella sp.]|uniref:tetratricopeptide repeat protein n=1 Tax=Reichenbachiella sp. TaxID=2184521 RepID=UPI003299F250
MKLKLFIYIFLTILIVSCNDSIERDAEELYLEAAEMYKNKQYEKSVEKLDFILNNEDLDRTMLVSKAFYLRGFISYLSNDSKKAYSDYLDAIDIADAFGENKMVSRLNNEIGQIFYERELYGQSLTYFKLALEQSDRATYQDRAYYNFGVGKSLVQLNRFDEAMDYLIDAIEINKQLRNNDALAGDYIELGKLQRRVGNFNLAYNHFEAVIVLAPITNNPNKYLWLANNNIGNMALETNQLDKSEKHLKRALEYNSNETQLWVTYNNLGKLYNTNGEYQKAWNCFKQSLAYNSKKGEMNELAITNNALKKTFEKLNQPDSLMHYTMLINDMALPMIQTKSWLKDEEEKIALLTKYQDYEREKSEREQYAKTSWLMAFIMTFIFVSGVLSMRLWKIYNYKSSQKGHALIKNSSEMVYLLDMFKKEKDEMKKVMDQKIGI